MSINLALLVFKPVRKSWQWWFPHCYSLDEFWKELFNPEVIGEDKWWKKTFLFVVFILVTPVYLLYAILYTLIPITVYRNAIDKYKRDKKMARMEALREPKCTVPSPEHWGANTALTSVQIALDLPFEPDIHDVFYVENEYDAAVNDYILEHYEELQHRFVHRDMYLVYLSKLSGLEVSHEVLQYMFPYLSPNTSFRNDVTAVEMLKQHIISGAVVGPALLHRIRQRTDREYSNLNGMCATRPSLLKAIMLGFSIMKTRKQMMLQIGILLMT